jgi:hypothetical protein
MRSRIRPLGVRVDSAPSDDEEVEARALMGRSREDGKEVLVCVKIVRRPREDRSFTPSPV